MSPNVNINHLFLQESKHLSPHRPPLSGGTVCRSLLWLSGSRHGHRPCRGAESELVEVMETPTSKTRTAFVVTSLDSSGARLGAAGGPECPVSHSAYQPHHTPGEGPPECACAIRAWWCGQMASLRLSPG